MLIEGDSPSNIFPGLGPIESAVRNFSDLERVASSQLDRIDAQEAGGAQHGKALEGLSQKPELEVRNERLTILIANMIHNPSDYGATRLANLTLPSKLAKDDDFRHQAFLSAKFDIACQIARANGWYSDEKLAAIIASGGTEIRDKLADTPLYELKHLAEAYFEQEADFLERSQAAERNELPQTAAETPAAAPAVETPAVDPAAAAAAEAAEKSHATAKGMADELKAFVDTLGKASSNLDFEATLKFDFNKLFGAVEQGVKDGTLLEADAQAVKAAAHEALKAVADKLGLPKDERRNDLAALRNLVTLKQQAEGLNRAIALRLNETLTDDARKLLRLSGDIRLSDADLDKLLNAAAEGKDACKKSEFAIIRTKWLEAQVAGQTVFSEFQATLPEKYRNVEHLESYIGAGVSNRKMLHTLEKTVQGATKGFGSNRDLLDICKRLATSDDLWAANAVLTRISRNLLCAYSIDGHQALQGDASALRAAVQTELKRTDIPSKVVDIVLRALDLKTEVTAESLKEQFAAAASKAARANELQQKTDARTSASRTALDALLEKMHDVKLFDTLKTFCDPETIDALDAVHEAETALRDAKTGAAQKEAKKNLKTAQGKLKDHPVKGAELATGVLALKVVLDDAGLPDGKEPLTWEKKKDLVGKIKFQKHIRFDQMRGSAGGNDDNAGTDFMTKLAALKSATKETWAAAAQDMNDFLTAHNAVEKALAVVAFKDYKGELSAVNDLDRKLDQDGLAGGDDLVKGLRDRMQKEYVAYYGAGSRALGVVKRVEQQVQDELAKVDKEKQLVTEDLSSHVKKTYATVINIALCEAFSKSGKTSLADVLAERPASTADYEGWSFFNDCFEVLGSLGLGAPRGEAADAGDTSDLSTVSKHMLSERIRNLAPDAFMKLEADTTKDWGLRFVEYVRVDRELNRSAGAEEIRNLMTLDEFERTTKDLLDEVEKGKAVALSQSIGANVSVDVVSVGAADIKVTAGFEHANKVSVRMEGDKYHATIMRPTEVRAGVAVEGILDCITLEGELKGKRADGCDLTFASKEDCAKFLAPLLAGAVSSGSLALCEEIKAVKDTQIGVSASISVGTDGLFSTPGTTDAEGNSESNWFEVSAEVNAAASVAWREDKNDNGITKTRTFHGEVGFSVGVQIAPDDVIDKVKDKPAKITRSTGGGDGSDTLHTVQEYAEKALAHNELKIERTYAYEERQSVTTALNGKITSAERTRAFIFESADDARKALADMGVPADKIDLALADVSDGEEFRLEAKRSITQDSLDTANTSGWKNFRSAKFELSEIRVVRNEQSAEKNHKFAIGDLLSIHIGAQGSSTRETVVPIKPPALAA